MIPSLAVQLYIPGQAFELHRRDGYSALALRLRKDRMEIPVELSRIVIRDHFEEQYIYVSEVDGPRGFPIVIGRNEALEIHRKASNKRTDRPMTHDLIHLILDAFDAKVVKVVINNLAHGTFFANLYVKRDNELVKLDCRPSDAIALATAYSTPLFVEDSVMKQVGKSDDEEDDLM